ncbi:macro domain-containing protein [Globicatella sulfidifaciens]|uniref:O-acetyl-ADP-ribose deacetylase (Regulator of RNase III), contains Macro domain n=1 Tax=Globicatella sulfidifaciens DSM 15739 TaxID=1121925 RepID=A0A1T4N1G9_9LACT|nr:macro domain-containing protein [Globicatella sulfidifaciens]SJZ72964.1 O-acetyl-ADP-ribose deacetylase (regulator of RNase III), contains Macro domain [Globicatella sulfidifaciens DSM 15739]
MSLSINHQDITQLSVDAIVNAANTELLAGGGVCGAIFKGAGYDAMTEVCRPLAPIKTGEAVMTPGFNLPAKHVIHAVGPIYSQYTPEEAKRLLAQTYTNSLQVAVDHQLNSIAFPLISSGIYGYPKEAAYQVAVETIEAFLTEHYLDVYLVLFP